MAKRFDIKRVPIRYFVLSAIVTAFFIFSIIAIQFIINFFTTSNVLKIYDTVFNIKNEISYLNNSVHTLFSNPYTYIKDSKFSGLYKSLENINNQLDNISTIKIAKNNPYYQKIYEYVHEYKINLQKCQDLNYKLFNPEEGKIANIENLLFLIKSNSSYQRPPFKKYTTELISIINELKTPKMPGQVIANELETLENNLAKLTVSNTQINTKNNLLILVDKIKNVTGNLLLLMDQYGRPFASGALKNLNTDLLLSSSSNFLENIRHKIIKQKLYYKAITLTIITLLLGILIIGFGLTLFFVLNKNLNKIIDSLKELELGNLERKELIKITREFGIISLIINRIVSNLKYKSKIISLFAQGKYNQEIKTLSPRDELGQNLIKLQEYLHNYEKNIQQSQQSEQRQKWITEGLAYLGDILRQNATDLNNLLENSLKAALDYLKAPMGAIYYVNYNYQEPIYELKIAFAYSKEKMHKVSYRLTEGFVGTVAADGEPIILKQVPEDYIFYETAFGYGRPNTIAWFPIKEENKIYGVLEIALNETFEEHHTLLIEKFASDLASTITFVNINQQTKHLVQQLTEKTEEFEQREIQYKLSIEDLNDKIQELQEQIENLKIDNKIKQDIISEKVAQIIELEKKIKEKEIEIEQTINRFKKAEELYKTKIANLQEQIKILLSRDSDKEE